MRRFDGHGASSYRPTNPEAAKQQSSALRALLAERERQDAGLFGSVQQAPTQSVPVANQQVTTKVVSNQQVTGQPVPNQQVTTTVAPNQQVTTTVVPNQQKAPEETGPTYSLSDAGC